MFWYHVAEIMAFMQASSELDAEVKKLTAERQRLATEVQMKREMEQQYAKRCTLQVPACISLSSPGQHMHPCGHRLQAHEHNPSPENTNLGEPSMCLVLMRGV